MSDNPVRRVTEEDIPQMAEWAIPRFRARHPRITLEGMMPLLKMSLDDPDSYFVRTDNACGLYAVERAPWEPLPTVCDVFLVARHSQYVLEALRIIDAAIEWAREKGAIEFRFGTDTDADLSSIADRVGYDRRAVNYVKLLTPRTIGETAMREHG